MKFNSLFVSLVAASLLIGCKPDAPKTEATGGSETAGGTQTGGKTAGEPAKLKITDLTPGTGIEAKVGDTVYMQYKGTLNDGTVFDENWGDTTKPPFALVLGQNTVIKGWEEGLPGMRVGGVRRLVVPPNLAYGENPPSADIPPNATLNFDVKLLAVTRAGEEHVVDTTDVKKGSGSRVVKDGDTVTIHYVGSYASGKEFKSTREDGKPVTFTLGKQQMITGMEAAVRGMRVGGVRKAILPPKTTISPTGQGGSTVLMMEIGLLAIK